MILIRSKLNSIFENEPNQPDLWFSEKLRGLHKPKWELRKKLSSVRKLFERLGAESEFLCNRKGGMAVGQGNNAGQVQKKSQLGAQVPIEKSPVQRETPENQSKFEAFGPNATTGGPGKNFRSGINIENLIAICSKKLEADPNHQKALFIRASSFLKKGLYIDAIKDCNKLLGIDKKHVGSYYVRGCAHERLGDIDKGISDFTTVLGLDPNHVNAAFARGACNNRKGNFDMAIKDYDMALEKDNELQQIKTKRMNMRKKGELEWSKSINGSQMGHGEDTGENPDDSPGEQGLNNGKEAIETEEGKGGKLGFSASRTQNASPASTQQVKPGDFGPREAQDNRTIKGKKEDLEGQMLKRESGPVPPLTKADIQAKTQAELYSPDSI